MTLTLALFQQLGPWEMGILLILALLLFGRRLPEVGKSLGKGIVEFKKGIKGIDDEIESESSRSSRQVSSAAKPPLTASGGDGRVVQGIPDSVASESAQGGSTASS